MSFCQFLKAFIFSVKCHLHSAWKHKSEDPAHEHNSSLTFRSECPELKGTCKDHWSPAPDISLQWASVNCVSWCLGQLSPLVIMLINQSQSLAPISQIFPSWSQWKLPDTYPAKFGDYAAKLVLWKALFCRKNEIWHVQLWLSGEMPFPQEFDGLVVLLCCAERWFCQLQKLFLVSVIWHRRNCLFCSMYLINLAFCFCSKRHFDFFFYLYPEKFCEYFMPTDFIHVCPWTVITSAWQSNRDKGSFFHLLTGHIKLD